MYPQYSDLSDADLSDKLHRKYYTALPKESSNIKIGIPTQNEEALANPDFEPTDLITLPKMAKLGVTMGVKAIGKKGIQNLSDILSRQYAKTRFKVGSKLLGEEEMTRYITNKNIDKMFE